MTTEFIKNHSSKRTANIQPLSNVGGQPYPAHMIQISVPSDCGNAPKKQVLRDYSIALAKQDKETVLSAVADGVEWEIVGRPIIRGKADFAAFLDTILDQQATMLNVDTILTHGNEGAVNSSIEFSDTRRLRCCDVYKFSSHSKTAKIKHITSYWIEM